MKNLLVLNSSILGNASVSRRLVEQAVERLQSLHPGLSVVQRDLGEQPVPHLTTARAGGITGQPATPDEKEALALSDQLIAELRHADLLVIGAPMYNFSIATGLRAWFDHVIRAGHTFTYGESGARGLITGKRAIVVLSRGGDYSEAPANGFDFQEPYLKALLGFIGITDVAFVHAQKLAFGPEGRAASIESAEREVVSVVLD